MDNILEQATMENYEQKYKEIVERIKEFHAAGNFLTKKQMEIILPELAESEDERIRKELLAVINDLVLPDEQKARFNAWLEKQKEQKPAEWSEDDEEMFDEALAGVLLARNRMNDTGCIGLAERFEKAYKWLESFRPRPHWKPSEEQMRALKIARSFFSENPTLSEILKALYEQLKKLM